jgi:spore protease
MYEAESDDEMSCVSGFIPGVMGSTGMETADLIQSAAKIAKPEVIIAVDSLAARNVNRISTTIQISDTGISPGAGTGNMRKQLTEKTLGTKVIAIGVPTVIDSKTLILDNLIGFLSDPYGAEKYIDENGVPMIVTSTEIDQVIKDYSDIISNGINITLHPGIYS